MNDPRLFDPGLQPERTELAWRRTALAIGVGSLIALRLLPALAPTSDGQLLWLTPGLIGVAFAAGLWTFARRRYRLANAALSEGHAERAPGGALLLTLTLFVVACGILSAGFILLFSVTSVT
jgi:uncharacterized membrane protein YidH (DUF202 family)